MRVGPVLMRVGVPALLAASGLVSIAAARERWWPACGQGGFDTRACLSLQDHQHDLVPFGEPWQPVGGSAEIYGLALLLLAVAVALLPLPLFGRRPGAATWALSVMMSLSVLVVAASTWLSGRADEVVTPPALGPAAWFWLVGWPIALSVWVVLTPGQGRPHIVWRPVALALLMMSTPLAQMLLAPMLVDYTSHDTAPWSEAVSGSFLVGAGIAVWLASGHAVGARGRDQPRGGREGPVGRTTAQAGP